MKYTEQHHVQLGIARFFTASDFRHLNQRKPTIIETLQCLKAQFSKQHLSICNFTSVISLR